MGDGSSISRSDTISKIEMKEEHKVYVETLVHARPQYKCCLLFSNENKGTK